MTAPSPNDRPFVVVTNADILRKLEELDDKVEALGGVAEKIEDHGRRLGKLEARVYGIAGAALAGIILGVLPLADIISI